MAKTNLQIRLSDELDTQIEAFAPKSKSEFVREAIEEKIQREKDLRQEEAWIKALSKAKSSQKEDKTLEKAQTWGSK